MLVAGASTHPGKFGFVSLHNLLASGYEGAVFGTNLQGEEVLGIQTVADVADLPDGAIDLVFVCTPASANLDAAAGVRGEGRPGGVPHVGRLRRGRRGGQAGRGRAGRARRRARHPARRARTARASSARRPSCAPRSSRRTRRPAASASPARAATSCRASSTTPGPPASASAGPCRPGNAAAVTVADYLDYYADDPATAVGLAYVEGIADGRALLDRLGRRRRAASRSCSSRAGATEGGARAAASHTGALAADDKVFDGECRAAGITRAADRRGGVRGGGHVRHPAAAGRARTSSC